MYFFSKICRSLANYFLYAFFCMQMKLTGQYSEASNCACGGTSSGYIENGS